MISTEIKSLMREGADLHLAGNMEMAEERYREALLLDGNNAVAHNNLGFLLSQTRKFDEAEIEYFQALEINPEYATAHSNLGLLYLILQRWEEAEQQLLKAISFDQNDFQANENLAKIYMLKGDFPNSEIFWKKCYSIQPQSSQLIELSHVLITQKKLDEAMDILQNILSDEEDNPRLYSLLGIIYFAKYDFGSAIKCFKRTLGIEPENAEARHNLAMSLLKTGQNEEALNEFRRILLLDPDHTEARNNLAVIELAADQTDSALNHFTIILEKEPENAKALYYKSIILFNQGYTDEARKTLTAAIATNHPDYKKKAEEIIAAMN
jgi:Flp pilus assembly protein TadD